MAKPSLVVRRAWTYQDLAAELLAQGIRPDFIDGKAVDFAAPTVEAATAGVELDAWFHDNEQEDEEWQDEELHRLLTEH